MSISLNLTRNEKSESKLHSIPCKIANASVTSNVNIAKYFEGAIREKDNVLTTTLRGRPLDGIVMTVPSGYTGVIATEPRKRFNEEEDREFIATKTFKEFHFWNLDRAPSENDKLTQAFEWIDIARTVHSPLSDTNEKITQDET